jgi:hypothetical protein
MYTLQRACWIVRKLDSSPGRLSMFDSVMAKSALIRFCYGFYSNAPGLVQALLLLLYGAKCYLSLKWAAGRAAEIAVFASYPNERVALAHLRRRLPGRDLADLDIATRHCLEPQALAALPAFLLAVPRLYPVARQLARRLHFMPACRVFSAVTYNLRCRRLLEEHDVAAVFIANHYSPECLALAVAAQRTGRKVIFANHANATWESGYVPPLYSDLAAVTGQAVLDVYRRSSRKPINAIFIPPASPQSAMRSRIDPQRAMTVGIFLTGLTDMVRLRSLVEALKQNPRVRRILIRPHPVAIVNDDISELCSADGQVVDVSGTLLYDNAQDCDLAICGNSTAAIEILRGGAPLLYDNSLDRCGHDFNGYLKRGLVLALPKCLDESALESVQAFYGNPAWTAIMRHLDASYGRDEAEMFRQLNLAIAATLATRSRVRDRATQPGLAAGLPEASPVKS